MVKADYIIANQPISIHTFGKFHLQQDEIIISRSSTRSKRMWELFKFLLSHRDKGFSPETILEKVWPERDYQDPNLVMRALIYRLRQALNIKPDQPNLASNIVFSQGSYSWEENTLYWIDADVFEELINEADAIQNQGQDQAISLYRQALALYNGEYLPELSYSEWIEPLRTYYHELFIDSVLKLIDLLKAKGDRDGIIKICEQAIGVDYFQEKIHLKMIEALIAEEKINRARAHYNEVTSAFYREMGIKPSEQMKTLYRLMGVQPGDFELDLTTIQEHLKGKDDRNGAFYCDPELFRYFYNLERFRVERNGQSILVGLLTLTSVDYSPPDKNILRKVVQDLEKVTINSLRKGDIVTRWNESQIMMLLPGLNREQAEKVVSRIVNNYENNYSLQELVLHKKVESLLPLEGDAHFF